MSTPPIITPPDLIKVPLIDPKTGLVRQEWVPTILAIIKKLNGL